MGCTTWHRLVCQLVCCPHYLPYFTCCYHPSEANACSVVCRAALEQPPGLPAVNEV